MAKEEGEKRLKDPGWKKTSQNACREVNHRKGKGLKAGVGWGRKDKNKWGGEEKRKTREGWTYNISGDTTGDLEQEQKAICKHLR